MRAIRVLSVASEIFPLIKTGGLADVVGALPAALAREKVRVRTLAPGYPAVLAAMARPRTVLRSELFGGPARILSGRAADLDLFALDAPHLFERPGNPYSDPEGVDWPDNLQRFAALSRAAAEIGRGAVRGFRPDVVHAHDWQAGMAPAYLRFGGEPRAKSVITIHNIAFQGIFPAARFPLLELPRQAFATEGVEYHGQVSFLKAGLQYADRITTVSPQYAVEIRSPQAGMGFDGLLRARSSVVSGIINGIDVDVWNPATDAFLPVRFDAGRPAKRAGNKAALQERLGLPANPDALLFGLVSRLSWQKGLDLLADALPTLLGYGAQLAVLGAGEHSIEQRLRAVQAAHPGQIGVAFGYDEALAHLIQGGSDALLVPSRFEPCGLTQLCALRYGSVPVVARVGGLADTVVDAGEMALSAGVATGVQFSPVDRDSLSAAIEKTIRLWRDKPTWRRIQANGMTTDVSWARPARRYAALYRELIGASG